MRADPFTLNTHQHIVGLAHDDPRLLVARPILWEILRPPIYIRIALDKWIALLVARLEELEEANRVIPTRLHGPERGINRIWRPRYDRDKAIGRSRFDR